MENYNPFEDYISLHSLQALVWQPANPRHDSLARDVE